jgi:hypothetical protein
MTLQNISDNDALALMPNESKSRYIMLIRIIYPPPCVASSMIQVIDDHPVNKNYYVIRIFKVYNLDHIQLLYQFSIFSYLDLLTEVLKRRWGSFLDILRYKLNQLHHSNKIIKILGLNEKINQIKYFLRSVLQNYMLSSS